MDGFEVFEGQRGRRRMATGPVMSLSRNGSLTLNEFAVGLFGKKPPETVQLLFNRKTRQIALKPARDGDEYTYRLKPDRSGARSSVHAKSFANHYGIDLSERRVVEAQRVDDLVVGSLEETAFVGQETREPVLS